jgi:hypothetical protein
MVEIAQGDAVRRLLERGLSAPSRYLHVYVCSPFIDLMGAAIVDRCWRMAMSGGPAVTVITTLETRRQYSARWHVREPFFRLRSVHGLHAKVYALVGRVKSDSVLLLTSANLTAAGIGRNRELGVQINGTNSFLPQLCQQTLFHLQRS